MAFFTIIIGYLLGAGSIIALGLGVTQRVVRAGREVIGGARNIFELALIGLADLLSGTPLG